MRVLDRLTSLKAKLATVIVAAILTTAVSSLVAAELGLALGWGLVASILLALGVVQVLARGLTAPLRQMARAAEASRRGEHGHRVEVRGRDEVARLAAAFNAMSAEFEATDELRRELVANVSHELRTPLSALQAVLENLVDGVQEPDEATLRAMHAQVARLDRLVAQLLDLSRLEAGAVPLEVQPLEARAILGAACSEARLHAPAGLQLVVDVDPADLACAADPDRVQQVLANLVENAIRVSPARGVVTLAARSAGPMVRLEVADQGPGIPAADRARVFERFHRLDAARSGGGGGAGLGLAIARWIVELHGGAIRAEAGGPVGCRMVVELPAAAP